MNQDHNSKQSAPDFWQIIQSKSKEEFAEEFAAELNKLSEAIKQLNLSAHTKLPDNKTMLWKLVQSVEQTKGKIEVLIEMNKDSGKKSSGIVHQN